MSIESMKKGLNINNKKIIGEAIATIVGLIIAFIDPPEGLTVQSMKALGILVWTIINWVIELIPNYVAALLMCLLWATFKVVPFTVAFGAFSGTVWWLLIGAMGIGIAASKSGLLKRASLMGMRLFPPTFKGQVLAFLGTGTIVAPLIPSITVKCTITAPIAIDIGKRLGFEKRSKGMNGLFAAMFVGFSTTSVIFVSGSILGYLLLGLLPDYVQEQFNWIYWFICMIPWGIIILAASYLFIIYLYKPNKEVRIPSEYINSQIKALGPMSRDEKITLAVVAGCLIFWIGESFIGVPAAIVAMIGMLVLISLNVFSKAEFHNNMAWSILFFTGSILNLGPVLQTVGINAWLGQLISPLITRFVGNTYLLVTAIALLVYIVRTIITSMSGTITLFTIILLPIAFESGINPWVVGIATYASVMVWHLQYQNSNFLAAFAAVGGEENISFKEIAKLSFVYMVISIIGLLISIPYWRFLGLIP
ncbi:MAG: sodium:calcium symporter [Tissierellia bacterium]|nr:sodium:calcium symporter [Tissierellia bacterium]